MTRTTGALNSIDRRLVYFISSNYKDAYHYHARGKTDTEKLYLRLLLVTDFICGMTDSYAKRLYQELKAISDKGRTGIFRYPGE